MNKFLRVLFILILAMTGAIIFQYFPNLYGNSRGMVFQLDSREIGIWNVAVLVILLAVNLKYGG